ncbi:MAG: hypothetical protein CMJ89_13865 [Planctomycetes bacterium]|nr:hypothetical protein [Planctomycetota bacterium]
MEVFSAGRAGSRGPGVVDTPPELSRHLGRGLISRLDGPQGSRGDPVRLLDPACGEGALLLAAGRLLKAEGRPFELIGIEIDPDRAAVARTRLDQAFGAELSRIENQDALEVEWQRGTAVLANPPWVSFSGREAAPKGASHLRRHQEAAKAVGRWPSLHGAFLARIAAHVASERRPARILLPASIAEQEGYAPLRAETTRLAQLDEPPELLRETSFPGVSVPGLLLTLTPRASAGAGSEEPWACLDPGRAERLEGLWNFPRLPPKSFRDLGVHTGNSARLLVLDLDPFLPALREGRDLTPFRLASPRHSLDVTLQPTDEQRFRHGELERYTSVPILLRQTASRPIAALHTDPTYFRNSLLGCSPPSSLAPEFCVAVLNASVAGAWHRLSFLEANQRNFPQVKIGHLRTQPFPFLERASAPQLHDEIVQRVRELPDEGFERSCREIDELVFEAFRIEPPRRAELRAAAQ